MDEFLHYPAVIYNIFKAGDSFQNVLSIFSLFHAQKSYYRIEKKIQSISWVGVSMRYPCRIVHKRRNGNPAMSNVHAPWMSI